MSFDDFLAVIEAPALREIARHWRSACGDRRMPGWKHIDPVAIARHLEIIWSWKYDRAADRFVGRLAGEAINGRYARRLRGVRMEDYFAAPQYRLIFPRHKRVVAEPAVAHGIGRVFVHADRYGMGERIVLPLATDGVAGDGILGATLYQVPETDLSGAPIWLDPKDEKVSFFPLP